MVKSRTLTTPDADEVVEQQEFSSIAGGNAKWASHLGRQVDISYKARHTLTIWSSKHTPWHLSKGVEIFYPHQNLHIMLTAALFTVDRTWKQPRCPSLGEWINKPQYIQTMEYYSVQKRNELSSHERMWRNHKCILLSERSQSEKAVYCMIPTIWHSGKAKLWRQ